MKLSEIQELIKFVAKSGVNEVAYETKDIKLVIKTGASAKIAKQQPIIMQSAVPMTTPIVQPVIQQNPVAQPVAQQSAKQETAVSPDAKLVTIKSPMIGTFYRSPGPDKPLFVNVGDEIKQGKVICIIEAMKLFNEIESEVSGKIVKVLVDDATPVEYDQPLFLVEPA